MIDLLRKGVHLPARWQRRPRAPSRWWSRRAFICLRACKDARGSAAARHCGGLRFAPTPLRCLYGRLPWGKCRFEVSDVADWLLAYIRPFVAKRFQIPASLAPMVIREVGAYLAQGLRPRLVRAPHQLYRPTVRPLCHHLFTSLAHTRCGAI